MREFFCPYDVLVNCDVIPNGALSVHRPFATSSLLLRRLVALTAAYAIVLSSFLVAFGAASAATITTSAAFICHTEVTGATAPTGSQPDGNSCDASCCLGCLSLLAAEPPPPEISVAVEQSAGERLTLPAFLFFHSDHQTKSHQSRAPPQSA